MKRGGFIPYIWYLDTHAKIYRWKGKEMTESDFRSSLFEWRVSKKVAPLIVKEMELIGLIKRKNRNKIILQEPLFNENDCNFYYKKLKIF